MGPNLDFEGVVNLRDVAGEGNIATAAGRVRAGVLFRSETPQQMTEGDVARARDELGIARVIDLRGPRGGGSGPIGEGGRGLVIDFFALSSGGEGAPDHSADGFLPAQLDVAGGVVGIVLEELASADGALLVHCHTGKDRTGFIVALILALVGVGDDEIIADYERSIPIFEEMMRRLAENGRAVPPDAPEYARDAPSQVGIRALLGRLRTEWPSPEAYLLDQGVDPMLCAEARRKLVVPATI